MKQNKRQWPKWPNYNQDDAKQVLKVIKSNKLVSWGNKKELYDGYVKKFENAFSKYQSVKYSLGVGNGTQGLHLALASININKGDEVIVPVYSHIATASCVLMQNATPIFVDTNKHNLIISFEEIKKKISKNTRAIILTILYGYSEDISDIVSYCKKNKIYLIIDSSHSHCSKTGNIFSSNFADISVFSLNERKVLPGGDAGVVTTNSERLAKKIYRLRSFGDKQLSYNYRMSEFSGAILLKRLSKINYENNKRIYNANYISQLSRNYNHFFKIKISAKKYIPTYYKLIIEFSLNKSKNDLKKINTYLNNKGINTELTYSLLCNHPHFQDNLILKKNKLNIKNYKQLYPNAYKFSQINLLQININPPVNKRHLNYLFKSIKNFYKI